MNDFIAGNSVTEYNFPFIIETANKGTLLLIFIIIKWPLYSIWEIITSVTQCVFTQQTNGRQYLPL